MLLRAINVVQSFPKGSVDSRGFTRWCLTSDYFQKGPSRQGLLLSTLVEVGPRMLLNSRRENQEYARPLAEHRASCALGRL